MSSEKSLQNLMKNLNYQIKFNQVAKSSWKGKKSFTNVSNKNQPTVDYLLNNASKVQREQTLRNDMINKYLEKQKQPIIVGGIKYKFHNIPSPDLDEDIVRLIIIPPQGPNETINIDKNLYQRFLTDENAIIEQIKTQFKDVIDAIKQDILNYEDDIRAILLEIDKVKMKREQVVEEHRQLKLTGSTKQKNKARSLYSAEKKRIDSEFSHFGYLIELRREFIAGAKNDLKILEDNLEKNIEEIKEKAGEIRNIVKKNRGIIKNYQNELNNLNRGAFNTEQAPNESEESYLARLERQASIPYDDQRVADLAFMEEKKELRDRFKELIRSDSLISQVINKLNSTNGSDIIELNKTFEKFKKDFLKKYGYDNQKLTLDDIMNQIKIHGGKLEQEITENRLILRGPTQFTMGDEGDDLTVDQDIISQVRQERQQPDEPFEFNIDEAYQEQDFGIPGDEAVLVEGVEESKEFEPPEIARVTRENDYTLKITKIDEDTGEPLNSIYLRYKVPKYTITNLQGNDKIWDLKELLISDTGDDDTFRSTGKLSSSTPFTAISDALGIEKPKITKLIGASPDAGANEITQKIFNLMGQRGVQPSPIKAKLISKKDGEKSAVIGEGLSNNKKHDKVQFGDVIIMLNKLYYHNILSVSRLDGVKINGFKNKRVSDDFVMCIINILDNENYHKELNKLSSTERILLDNLLKLANLHKKVITGSGNESIEKLKNELQILEGQIQAGNNNESLKKKLHDILHKLAYFKVISLTQATKHYKDIIKNFF
jgi:hypothetical protein